MYTIYTIEYAEKKRYIDDYTVLYSHLSSSIYHYTYYVLYIRYGIIICTIDPELCTADVRIRHWEEGV